MQDNQAFRALFSLPPVQTSTNTALTVPGMPAPKVVTGDRELDAVLWLRDCIKTGHAALIAQALEAFKKIKTPAKELEDRYCEYLRITSGGNPFAVIFGGMVVRQLPLSPKPYGMVRNHREEAKGSQYAVYAVADMTRIFAQFVSECMQETPMRASHRHIDRTFQLLRDGKKPKPLKAHAKKELATA